MRDGDTSPIEHWRPTHLPGIPIYQFFKLHWCTRRNPTTAWALVQCDHRRLFLRYIARNLVSRSCANRGSSPTVKEGFGLSFYGPKMKRARSVRSISYGVTHLIPKPMQESGILIFFVEVDAFS
jgi:hypothetical protein